MAEIPVLIRFGPADSVLKHDEVGTERKGPEGQGIEGQVLNYKVIARRIIQ